jgi:hypothetical protein
MAAGKPGDQIPIYDLAETCETLFDQLLTVLSTAGEDHYQTAQQLRSSFERWAGFLGVFAAERVSLDRRLKSRPQIRDRFIRLLKVVERNAEHGTCQCFHRRELVRSNKIFKHLGLNRREDKSRNAKMPISHQKRKRVASLMPFHYQSHQEPSPLSKESRRLWRDSTASELRCEGPRRRASHSGSKRSHRRQRKILTSMNAWICWS